MQTKVLPNVYDYIAPDGSEIRLLLELRSTESKGGGLAHCTLPPGCVSVAHYHKTVGEIWYFLQGNGQVWRKTADRQCVDDVRPGYCLTIEAGTRFQFRNTGTKPMMFVIATIPPWPGKEEAVPVEGYWSPTVSLQ